MTDSRSSGSPDFVDRLVAKAFGTPEAAPRVPSAYEPTPAGRAGAGPASLDALRGDDDPHGRRTGARGAGWPIEDDDAGALSEGRWGAQLTGSRGHGMDDVTRPDAAARRPGATRRGGAATDDSSGASGIATSSSISPLANSDVGGQDASSHERGLVKDGGDASGLLASNVRAGFTDRLDGGDRGGRSRRDARSGVNGDDEASDGGTLGRSPFDPRTQARERAASDGTGLDATRDGARGEAAAHDAHASDRERDDFARLDPADARLLRELRDLRASDSSAREGAMLTRDRGLAQRLASASAMRDGDSRARRRGGDGWPGDDDVTVNVTIGRIDVRAVQTASATSRQTQARGPQPVALDDYLAQRGGGTR